MTLTQLSAEPAIYATEEQIRIVPAALAYLESFRECLDSVARERRWLGLVEAPPIEKVREYWGKHIDDDEPAFLRLRTVAWSDSSTSRSTSKKGAGTAGSLALGSIAIIAAKGIGTRLMRAAIEKARRKGLMRVELSVYATNPAGAALYRGFGFREEGRLVKGAISMADLMT